MRSELTIPLSLALAWCVAACGLETMAEYPERDVLTETARPAPPTIAIELDVLGDVTARGATLERAIRIATSSFADVGIELAVDVSRELHEQRSEQLADSAEKSMLMIETRDRGDAIHVIVARRGAGAHGVTHYDRGSAASPKQAGVFVFAESIADDFASNPLLREAGLSEAQLIGRTLAHELGHSLGCPHPPRATGDVTVMVQNSELGAVTPESVKRWRAALIGDGRGHPLFSDSARACLRLETRLSVELARPAYAE